MTDDSLDLLRRLVVDDPLARERLLPITDRSTFVAEVIDVARELGIGLSPAEVERGMVLARTRRFERWL